MSAEPFTLADLRDFCGKDETRPYLHRPFRYRGERNLTEDRFAVYATNGHIAIRWDCAPGSVAVPPQDVLTREAFERAIAVPDGVTFDRILSAAWPVPVQEPCESCAGLGHYADKTTCENCDGEGHLRVAQWVTFDKALVSVAYFRLLTALPGVEIARPAAYGERVFFRFAEGVGTVASGTRKTIKPETILGPAERFVRFASAPGGSK